MLLGLSGRAASEVTGYQTHKVVERKFAAVAAAHRGTSIDGGVFPGTALRNFQMLAVFGSVLIARATIGEVRALPKQCASRVNGSTINWPFSGQEGLFPPEPLDDPAMFALLLTCKDKEVRGRFHEIALGVIEPDHSGFIFYEFADSFISSYRSDGSDETSVEDKPTPRLRGRFRLHFATSKLRSMVASTPPCPTTRRTVRPHNPARICPTMRRVG